MTSYAFLIGNDSFPEGSGFEPLTCPKNDVEELSQVMMLSSLCGLGATAPIPVLDSLRHFRSEVSRFVA